MNPTVAEDPIAYKPPKDSELYRLNQGLAHSGAQIRSYEGPGRAPDCRGSALPGCPWREAGDVSCNASSFGTSGNYSSE